MKATFLIGRLIFGGFFLYSGINHFKNLKGMAQYAGAKNAPYPEASVAASGAMLIVGGASMIAGLKPKYGAAALLGFLATVSPVMHDFWNDQDPQQKQNQMIHFMKNMALLGAAAMLMSVKEPWLASLQSSE